MEYIRDTQIIDQYFQSSSFGACFGFEIRNYTSMVHFRADDIILEEGETPASLYYLIRGRTKLFITHKNGRRSVINFLEAPSFLGEMEVLYSSSGLQYREMERAAMHNGNSSETPDAGHMVSRGRQSHGVVAITDCLCFSVDIRACRDKLANDVRFLRHLCLLLSEKAKNDTYNYSKNQSYPLKIKLASYILMTENRGIYRERHTETAEYLGVTYRHLLYVLAEFTENGILEKNKAGYRIKDWKALGALAEL